MVLAWLMGMVMWFIVIGGVVMKNEMLWWYNLSHVVAGISAVIMGILMPLVFLSISSNPDAVVDALIKQAKLGGGLPSTVKRISWGTVLWSVIVSVFFFCLYISQGWVAIAGFHLVAGVSWWAMIPFWNRCVDEARRRI